MNEQLQDGDLAKADIRNHDRLKSMRAPWEATWQEIDERFPNGAGGFKQQTPGQIRGARNYDTTHISANKRFAAAGVAITTPEEKQYIRVKFHDKDLMKSRMVQLWCARASQRMYEIRHAVHTGFNVAANEDWDQLGRYGTSPMFVDGKPGRGMSYQTLHLSEVYIDVGYGGRTDTVHRLYKKSARQLEEEFGLDALTPKMRDALRQPGKENTEFDILHVIEPNRSWDREKLDWRRMPIVSRYLAVDEKIYLRRAGFFTHPIPVSRHATSAGEIYGRSPAIDQMPTIQGVNAMRNTLLRALHKAVDPAIMFSNDAGITKLVTRPGGLNPGLWEDGRPMAGRMPGGENGIPLADNAIEQERAVIRIEFLEEFYKILTDPNSRMTTTEVLEVMAKQGVLVRPFASRYATEKQDPVSQRELDLCIRYGQLDPFPPEVLEAGAWPHMEYENPLASMARAERVTKGMRFVEAITPLAQLDGGAVLDYIDYDTMAPGMAEDIGVPPEWIRDQAAIAQLREQREEEKRAAIEAEMLKAASGATLDFAKAGQISEAA
ncbi:portal protein [Novosphingobium guangzhouense]|uniref:Phage head-tail adapter protein n=1 Tax=Novosphingobium guangzhouense TaxID=1850347 RepID=A0A2K2G453_9SPHN|nr:portal protein [Novosphingobium guangzhouense]PNU05814.1 hypothetical protein A8V01_14710 [Novosphingobium guangzhouense]